MLDELAKFDKDWRYMALSICKNKHLADDIVNDMYIKMHECGKKWEEVNHWYVCVVMKNLYLHHLRKTKKEVFISYENIEMVNDQELTKDREYIDSLLDKLNVFDREILLHTSERSLRKNQEYLEIPTAVLFYRRKQALEKLKDIFDADK